jgi:hypothetical protein
MPIEFALVTVFVLVVFTVSHWCSRGRSIRRAACKANLRTGRLYPSVRKVVPGACVTC